jgi:branched-chain amino acid transport system ATP-binding protein
MMLSVHDLRACYGDFQALFGIDLDVHAGEVVALIGANGAGKSTLLRTICGELPAPSDAVRFAGEAIGGLPAHRIVAKGIALVPEGRRLFPSLSLEENLLIGGSSGRSGPWTLARIYQLFPMLQEHRLALSTTLSGGQQQMVAIGRALMSTPQLLLCDELSLGLAPLVVKTIYAALPALRAEGVAMIIVEQNLDTALQVTDRFYCLTHGRVVLHGRSSEVSRAQIAAAYFGI